MLIDYFTKKNTKAHVVWFELFLRRSLPICMYLRLTFHIPGMFFVAKKKLKLVPINSFKCFISMIEKVVLLSKELISRLVEETILNILDRTFDINR